MSPYIKMLEAVDAIALYLASIAQVTLKSHGIGDHYADFSNKEYTSGRIRLTLSMLQLPPAEVGAESLPAVPTVTLTVKDISIVSYLKSAFPAKKDPDFGPPIVSPIKVSHFRMPEHGATLDDFIDRIALVIETYTGLKGVSQGLKNHRFFLCSRMNAIPYEQSSTHVDAPGANM